MNDEDLIKRGEVKAFRQSFIYDGGYPDVKLVSAVTIEDIDNIQPVLHEMTVREFFTTIQNMCPKLLCKGCPLDIGGHPLCPRRSIRPIKESDIEFIEKWAEENSERNEKNG